jgi:phage shock protein A
MLSKALGSIAVVLLALLAAQSWRLDRSMRAREALRATVAVHEAARAEAAQRAAERLAQTIRAHQVVTEDMNREIERANARATRLRRDGDSLRVAAEDLRQRVEAATAAGRSETAAAALAVHADVLGRCERERAELADYADRSRAAGAACERAYDAMSSSSNTSPESSSVSRTE